MTTPPTPAEEIRRAAFLLRNSVRGLKVVVDVDLRDPLADWLDFEADLLDMAPHIEVQPRTERALAVARLINQEQP